MLKRPYRSEAVRKDRLDKRAAQEKRVRERAEQAAKAQPPKQLDLFDGLLGEEGRNGAGI